MRKLYMAVLQVFLIAGISHAQVDKATMMIEEQSRPALTVSFKQDDDLVKDVLESEAKKNSSRLRKSKGVLYAKGIKLQELGGKEMTVYYTLNGTGRKKKRITTVTMALQRPDGTFLDSSDVELSTRANIYLGSLEQRVMLYDKDMQIAEMQKELKKLNASLKDSRKDHQKSTEKKMKQISDLESRLNTLMNN